MVGRAGSEEEGVFVYGGNTSSQPVDAVLVDDFVAIGDAGCDVRVEVGFIQVSVKKATSAQINLGGWGGGFG